MKIFYHNYTAVPRNDHLPEVLRARYNSLPELKEKTFYEVTLTSYLGILSFSGDSELWRFAGEKNWQKKQCGVLYLFAPGTSLELWGMPDVWRHGMMIYFQGGESVGIDSLFLPGEKVAVFDDVDSRFSSIIADIAMLPSENSFWESRLKLLQFLTLLHTTKNAVQSSHTGFADNVDNLLRRSLYRVICREEIAKELNISVSLLSHRYLQERGISVMQRHMQMRLELAKQLLLAGETIQRAADILGFSSSFHFFRAFKQYYGSSPAKYIRQLLRESIRN